MEGAVKSERVNSDLYFSCSYQFRKPVEQVCERPLSRNALAPDRETDPHAGAALRAHQEAGTAAGAGEGDAVGGKIGK
jgi:hypothetical protein